MTDTMQHLYDFHGLQYWKCTWCEQVMCSRERVQCGCIERYVLFGKVHRFEKVGDTAKCHVCLLTWHSVTDPEIEHCCGPEPGHGVGTELTRIFTSFGIASCNTCKARAKILDKWSVDVCTDRREKIIMWLTAAAKDRWLPPVGIPYLVDSAINAARKYNGSIS